MAQNVELNITMACNQRCANCNRMCERYPARTEDMTASQIARFIDQAWGSKVGKVKVVGGEPLLNPQFGEIFTMLVEVNGKAFRGLKIEHNGTLPGDAAMYRRLSSAVRWLGKPRPKKMHLPVLWSPTDLGLPLVDCAMPRRCGFSLDKYGWLPCSAAIMVVRVFGLWHLYRKELPTAVWGLAEICKHCAFAGPPAWRDANAQSASLTDAEHKTPTRSWAVALADYDWTRPPPIDPF
jgi:hypothetical protein